MGGVTDRTTLQTVAPRDVVKVGQHFSVEFIRNTHSMADSFSLAITTPVGTVIFTGDFKFDHTPLMVSTLIWLALPTTAKRVFSACSVIPPMPRCLASVRQSARCSPTSTVTLRMPRVG